MELQADAHTVVSCVCHMKVMDCGSSNVKGTVNNLQFAPLRMFRSVTYAQPPYYYTDMHSIVRVVIVNTMVLYVDIEDLDIHV